MRERENVLKERESIEEESIEEREREEKEDTRKRENVVMKFLELTSV